MTIPTLGRSTRIALAVAVAVSGLFAARVIAGPSDNPARGEDMAPRLFARAARRLELTEDQQTQIRAVLKSHAAEIEAQVRAGRNARRALHDAASATPVDEAAIRNLGRQLGDSQASGAILFAKVRAEALPILKPEQQEKLKSFQAHRRARGDESLQSLRDWLEGQS